MTTRSPESSSRPTKRKALLAATVLLAAGHIASSPDVAATPPKENLSPGVTVYEDPAFNKPLGEVAAFAVVCADYKDPQRQSLHPSRVISYKVQEELPVQHTPPLAGYVEPLPNLVVIGSAPAC